MIGIAISNTSDVPIYQQIYDQIAAGIIRGDIRGDEALPSIRTLSSELGVSVITVKRTFEELERSGYIVSVPGKGCYVLPLTHSELMDMRNEMAANYLGKNMGLYKSLGITKEELKKIVDEQY